ncbi:hypothetical protein M9Y10_023245 [Tritrichomonas musculus]|uniref:Adaptin N terminal region family protein n=1 Tax=Tritrichomonas musculus TaxID=1915356 RepID=A0ABR2KV69_9EUKA
MTDPFNQEGKGEETELREQLDGNDPDERKNAAKRVVSLMRSGENVSGLFSSMLRCVKSSDVELKKLTYLYLLNYSAQESEQAIMVVNTFIQDSQDGSPFIRALAVRTMCRIKLESVAEHMIIPLKKTLHDPDPYVRKTAALGVAKLYDVIPEAVENANIFEDLLGLLHDDNPLVISNTITSVFEINERRTTPIFTLNSETIAPILNAITSCSEWCQVSLFDALSRYKPESHEDASFLVDRLVPFLKHSNPAVVIGSFKCIFLFMESDDQKPTKLFPQIIPPFITLVSTSEPEVQYVILRTLSLFVQRYPKALSKQIRVFFCKYNDPSYIKMEKLDIIVTICKQSNAQLVLNELNEYSNSVDVAFVRKSIRCIGQIGIKMKEASPRCVDILVQLVGGKADYAVEESICVLCDIFRKYPGQFESVLNAVCSNFELLKEPRAKAAGIWILGEYCHIIENVDVLLDPYLDTFHDEEPLVQLTILSSLVKIFVHKPDLTRDQLQFVLNEATKPGNIPDVKNRALIYWRVLSADPELQIAHHMLTFDKQTVIHSGVHFDPNVLTELIRNMGSVSGVLHVVPSDFVRRVQFIPEDSGKNGLPDSNVNYNINYHQLRLNDSSNIDVFADYDRSNIYLRVVNKSQSAIGQFAFAVNSNAIGLTLVGQPQFPEELDSGDFCEVNIPIKIDPSAAGNFDKHDLQIALRTSIGTIFALDKVPLQIATLPENIGQLTQDTYRQYFASYTAMMQAVVQDAQVASDEHLKNNHVFVIGKNENKTYVSFALPLNNNNCVFVAELVQSPQSVTVNIKGPNNTYFNIIQQTARELFTIDEISLI